MLSSQTLTLFDYHYWATNLILEQVEKISHGAFIEERTLSWKSIRGTLVHMLSAEYTWRQRCQYHNSPRPLPESDYPTLGILNAHWSEDQSAMRTYLRSLHDDDLQAMIDYRTSAGILYSTPLWQILTHVIMHGMQHRAELAHILTELGYSPGDIDFIAYLRQRGQ